MTICLGPLSDPTTEDFRSVAPWTVTGSAVVDHARGSHQGGETSHYTVMGDMM